MSKKSRRSKRKPKKRSTTKNSKVTGKQDVSPNDEPLMSFFSYSSPFAQASKEELAKGFQEFASQCAIAFEGDLTRTQELIKEANPLALIAMAVHVTICRPIESWGKTDEEENRYFASHLEILQALILQQDIDAFYSRFVEPATLHDVMEGVKNLATIFTYKRLQQMSSENSEQKNYAIGVVEQFRIHTQDVRNEGYLGQMCRVYKELLNPLDTDFEKVIGVSGTRLLDCFAHTVEQSNIRADDYLKKLQSALTASSGDQAAEAYADSYGLSAGNRKRVREYVQVNNLTDDSLHQYLIWQTLNSIHRTQIWDISEWSSFLNVEETVTKNVF